MVKKKVKSVKKSSVKRKTKKALKKNVRVSSGIVNLDKLIQGGFEKDSTNLLMGQSGCGKSLFLTQFLVEGIKRGETGLFINFEEKKEEFYANVLNLGFDLTKLEKEGKFFFLEYTPQKVKIMLEEGGGEIESIVLNQKISRIAIDSMTSFMMLFRDELEKKEAILSLFDLLKGWKCTSVITSGGNKDKGPQILELESDSIIQLYFTRSLIGLKKRFLEIEKMRGTDHSLNLHEMKITKKGIIVELRPLKNAKKFISKI